MLFRLFCTILSEYTTNSPLREGYNGGICHNSGYYEGRNLPLPKAEPPTSDDLPVTQDLLDTPAIHKDSYVGMAANIIGVQKRIIVFENEGKNMAIFLHESSRVLF